MTSFHLQDSIAIDTNVFEHLLNPEQNNDDHINALLDLLQRKGTALLIDDGRQIANEYNDQIAAFIQNADENRNERYILLYWMLNAPKTVVSVDSRGRLMKAVKKVIVEPREKVDRVFVHVALSQGRTLISNDWRHIVLGPPRENGKRKPTRRERLLKDTKKLRPRGAQILTSQEASA